MQELEEQIKALFSGYPYRKISYHYDRKEILLQFDYPDAQDLRQFEEKAGDFSFTTGWKVSVSPSMNHNAASLLLSELFGRRIIKISCYPEKRCYQVTAAGEPDPVSEREAAEKFRKETGWSLFIGGAGRTAASSASDAKAGEAGQAELFLPSAPGQRAAEQNLAFFCIDQAFEETEHRPDKKSLRQDADGKYLELGFISPEVGQRYREIIQELADQTGWRFRISDKVNQNALFQTAQFLCRDQGIVLLKNPSYLPVQRRVQLKVSGEEKEEALRCVEDEFEKRTGLACVFI